MSISNVNKAALPITRFRFTSSNERRVCTTDKHPSAIFGILLSGPMNEVRTSKSFIFEVFHRDSQKSELPPSMEI